jgi:hypothetical protein
MLKYELNPETSARLERDRIRQTWFVTLVIARAFSMTPFEVHLLPVEMFNLLAAAAIGQITTVDFKEIKRIAELTCPDVKPIIQRSSRLNGLRGIGRRAKQWFMGRQPVPPPRTQADIDRLPANWFKNSQSTGGALAAIADKGEK